MKAIDFISSAMRLINLLATGEVPSGQESADAFQVLNDMIDSWNAERLMIYTIQINDFPLVPGQQTYTLGTGGNFNMARPARIQNMSVIMLNNPAQPLELPLDMLTDEQWQQIPVKAVTSTLPQKVYDDGAYPLRNLSFWCIPQVIVNTRIYSWSALAQFADLNTTDYTFPPAYRKAIRYNLAVDLAPEFGRELPAAVAAQAIQTKAMVQSMNLPIVDLACDPMLVRPDARIFDWRTGDPLARR